MARLEQAGYRRTASGFSLVEMAVVLVLMTMALTMGLGLLRANQEKAAWNETKAKQERIKVALISFLRTNGRLPCPNSIAPWDGAEDAANANPGLPATTCTGINGSGIIPWQAMGISQGEVVDGWGNFFTYRVANRTPATSSNWTIKSGTGPFSITELTSSLTTFSLQQRDTAGVLGSALVPNPVVLIISHGKNGLGARTVQGTQITLPAAGTDERTNATAGSNSFVDRNPTDVSTAIGGVFDDQVVYLTPTDLLQPLVDDKTLKGSNPAYYRTLAIQQIALSSCTPPAVGPSLAAVQPSIGNGTMTYTCPSAAYSCQTGTPMTAATPLIKQLYQLSIFGAAAQDVTFGDVVAAFDKIATRCP